MFPDVKGPFQEIIDELRQIREQIKGQAGSIFDPEDYESLQQSKQITISKATAGTTPIELPGKYVEEVSGGVSSGVYIEFLDRNGTAYDRQTILEGFARSRPYYGANVIVEAGHTGNLVLNFSGTPGDKSRRIVVENSVTTSEAVIDLSITDIAGTASTGAVEAVAANTNRQYVILQNTTSGNSLDMLIGLGYDPATDYSSGIVLGAGKSIEISPKHGNFTTAAINVLFPGATGQERFNGIEGAL